MTDIVNYEQYNNCFCIHFIDPNPFLKKAAQNDPNSSFQQQQGFYSYPQQAAAPQYPQQQQANPFAIPNIPSVNTGYMKSICC